MFVSDLEMTLTSLIPDPTLIPISHERTVSNEHPLMADIFSKKY